MDTEINPVLKRERATNIIITRALRVKWANNLLFVNNEVVVGANNAIR